MANSSYINSDSHVSNTDSYDIPTCSKDSLGFISNNTLNDPLNFQENWMGLINKNNQKFNVKKNHTWTNVPNGKISNRQMRFSYQP